MFDVVVGSEGVILVLEGKLAEDVEGSAVLFGAASDPSEVPAGITL